MYIIINLYYKNGKTIHRIKDTSRGYYICRCGLNISTENAFYQVINETAFYAIERNILDHSDVTICKCCY